MEKYHQNRPKKDYVDTLDIKNMQIRIILQINIL